MRALYLHGFASSPASAKGVALSDGLAAHGVVVERPDLNAPSFGMLTYSAALLRLEGVVGDGPVALIGSSLGGYLAARFAQLHPERVSHLVLLAPAFDMISRWRELLGDDAFALWQKKGAFFFPDADDEPTPVHWGLVEDALRHPPFPVPPCPTPTLIVHGHDDMLVPVETSQAYAHEHGARLVEVDDDHDLMGSLARITQEAAAFLLAGS